MDFVLALHSHLPWVLNHGRWPHGSDWLSEAAIDTYLPLLDALDRLAEERVPAPLTIGITPVLAGQLESPDFVTELEAYFTQRLAACDEARACLVATGDEALAPLADFWRSRLLGLRERFRREDGNLARAFRRREEAGQIELLSSAATHGFLPLLGRDESIRLQLRLGFAEHRRIFGREPTGLWLPECAYRPRGRWAPLSEAPRPGLRDGIEVHVAEAGFRYFFVDSHLAAAGRPFRAYGAEGEAPLPAGEDEPVGAVAPLSRAAPRTAGGPFTPYEAYHVARRAGRPDVAVFVRDPVASRQVWSRDGGYPGDEWYLEFHKIRWPGGLKYWRVSAPGSDLGAKQPYQPERARARAGEHARHFVALLERRALEGAGSVLAAPFDTELFGHWWFEGVDFLADIYRALPGRARLRPVTGRDHLAGRRATRGVRLAPGSWGAEGDFSMWLNPTTAWTWPRLWKVEEQFWRLAPAALAEPAHHLVLAQAARAMLLAMASDWQFIMSTGAVSDYAVRRFTGHCDDAEALLAALEPGAPGLAAAQRLAAELWQRDHLFPAVLDAVREVLGR